MIVPTTEKTKTMMIHAAVAAPERSWRRWMMLMTVATQITIQKMTSSVQNQPIVRPFVGGNGLHPVGAPFRVQADGGQPSRRAAIRFAAGGWFLAQVE